MKSKNYWDYLVEDGRMYQMGGQSHRIYLLDLLAGQKNDRIVQVNPIRSLLDIGCGTAPIYELLQMDAKKNDSKWDIIEKYKGSDYSEGMIRVCKKEFPQGDFAVEDARSLSEETASFDCVLLLHCLDHLDDYEKAINEAARVSRKYVCIVLWREFTTNGLNNLNDKNSYGRDDGGHWEDTHLQDYSKEKLLEAFKKAKLNLVLDKSDEEINKEGKHNTLFLLEKI